MPDLIAFFSRRWKLIAGLTLAGIVLALIALLLIPKKYLSVATALPANSAMADKGRLFNENIQSLYSDFGSPDELDRIEGTADLDTIFIATAQDFNLVDHYKLKDAKDALYKAAAHLKKNSSVARSGYGELKVKVWDADKQLAANMANAVLQKLQALYQHLQNETSTMVLQKIREDYAQKQQQYKEVSDSLGRLTGADADIAQARKAALLDQLKQDEKMIDQYQLSLNANPQLLLVVERARPALTADKPKILSTLLLAAFGAFIFSVILALFLESRKRL